MPSGFEDIKRHHDWYRRLVRIMKEHNRHAEEMLFFGLQMACKRKLDGNSFIGLANGLYGDLCGYGYSFTRAFSWWLGQMIVLGLVYTIRDIVEKHLVEEPGVTALSRGLMFSLAHSIPIPGLSSAVQANFGSAATSLSDLAVLQSILSTILLFLVLLTLRNHFRIK